MSKEGKIRAATAAPRAYASEAKANKESRPASEGQKYWLVKSEPDVWSWDQQVKKGTTPWDGVRNHQAANNLKAMKKGDLAFFYHSNEGKAIVGIVEVAKTAYPDPSDKTGKFVMVDMKAVKPLKNPVTLAQVKADPKLKDMALVKLSRLSVQPVTDAEWKHIGKLGGV